MCVLGRHCRIAEARVTRGGMAAASSQVTPRFVKDGRLALHAGLATVFPEVPIGPLKVWSVAVLAVLLVTTLGLITCVVSHYKGTVRPCHPPAPATPITTPVSTALILTHCFFKSIWASKLAIVYPIQEQLRRAGKVSYN
ncbi:hypothetical protein J6590_004229 [Homalodisca vitripennis]|nr:hypothetical protein J6590_004229 [Homalodisca vitripennis]